MTLEEYHRDIATLKERISHLDECLATINKLTADALIVQAAKENFHNE